MMTDDKPLTVRNHLLEHEDEPPEAYQVKAIDLRLLDNVSDDILNRLLYEKNLKPIDKMEGHEILGAIQGIGDKGADFQKKSEQEQNGMLVNMLHSNSLKEINEKFMVGMEYKPPMPAGPSGPQMGFVPMGPGMGGMRPMAPQPPAPGGAGPYFQPQQPPPYYPPQQGYPTYPPQPGYPPPGDAYGAGAPAPDAGAGGQGYAQPHPYPSYPVPPQPNYGYPPPHWPQQQGQQPHMMPPGYPPQPYPPAPWPPQQPVPVIIEAEEAKAEPTPAENADSQTPAG